MWRFKVSSKFQCSFAMWFKVWSKLLRSQQHSSLYFIDRDQYSQTWNQDRFGSVPSDLWWFLSCCQKLVLNIHGPVCKNRNAQFLVGLTNEILMTDLTSLLKKQSALCISRNQLHLQYMYFLGMQCLRWLIWSYKGTLNVKLLWIPHYVQIYMFPDRLLYIYVLSNANDHGKHNAK